MTEQEISDILDPLNYNQLVELGMLIYFSLKHGTTLEHAWRELEFKTFPEKLIKAHRLTRNELEELAIAAGLMLKEEAPFKITSSKHFK